MLAHAQPGAGAKARLDAIASQIPAKSMSLRMHWVPIDAPTALSALVTALAQPMAGAKAHPTALLQSIKLA